MEKLLFRKTERRLYDYFQKDRRIYCTRRKIELLEKHIADIERKMETTDIEIPAESKCITYGDVVQTSGVTSYAERAAMKMIENMENEIASKKIEIARLEKDIRELEEGNAIIEYNLSFVSEDHKKILELKYGQEKKDWQVGIEMNIERSTVTRIKQKLIADIVKWDRLIDKPCTK